MLRMFIINLYCNKVKGSTFQFVGLACYLSNFILYRFNLDHLLNLQLALAALRCANHVHRVLDFERFEVLHEVSLRLQS